MFFKVLAAMVTADAFDRRRREQQRRAWLAAAASQAWKPEAAPGLAHFMPPTAQDSLHPAAPERPT